MTYRRLLLLVVAPWLFAGAIAHDDPAIARYIANEGVLVSHGSTRVVFDPLFDDGLGHYAEPPAAIRAALLAGDAPWGGIDAAFISHYHDDHFSPGAMLALLDAQPGIRLFAPRQAVVALEAEPALTAVIRERIVAVDLEYGDAVFEAELDGVRIAAVRIPHTGWPERQEIENLAWRITLDDGLTVLHLGDADTRDSHFARLPGFWDEIDTDLALPPYWYFLSASGTAVLEERIQPGHAIGIHVPLNVPQAPAAREPRLRNVDLFTRPGETRQIAHEH